VPVKESLADITAVLAVAVNQDADTSIKYCGSTRAHPVVLGEWIPQLNNDYLPDREHQQSDLWITMTLDSSRLRKKPKLHSLYSCGYLYRTSCYLIEYAAIRTDKLQLLDIHSDSTHKSESDLEAAVARINASHDLFLFLHRAIPNSVSRDLKSLEVGAWRYVYNLIFVLAWLWHIIACIVVDVNSSALSFRISGIPCIHCLESRVM
jgi:hypothetical protein